MGALAVLTERVEIGTSALIAPYRNSLVLAKMLATADQLSQGRVLLGIGVGWMREEFEQLGLAGHYPIRGRVTDEWMRACIELWTSGGASSFSDEFHRFERVGAFPRCHRRPHVPIWVSGKGEIAARRAACYGSGYHSIASTPAELRAEIGALHCELENRGCDPGEATVSMLSPTVIPDGEARDLPAAASGTQQIVDAPGDYTCTVPACSTPKSPSDFLPATPERYMDALQYLAEGILPAPR